jgi:chromatin assembly factor 1 subunit B
MNHDEKEKFKLFLDENVIFTFVRRPDWSPDGSIFILPCGIHSYYIIKA